MRDELEQARVELLTAQTNAEYWDAMAAYNTSRVERLRELLGYDRIGPGKDDPVCTVKLDEAAR